MPVDFRTSKPRKIHVRERGATLSKNTYIIFHNWHSMDGSELLHSIIHWANKKNLKNETMTFMKNDKSTFMKNYHSCASLRVPVGEHFQEAIFHRTNLRDQSLSKECLEIDWHRMLRINWQEWKRWFTKNRLCNFSIL